MSASKSNYTREQSRLEIQKSVKKTEKWDVYSTGRQNLAAALNDPHYRDLGLFTRTWGESFVHTTPIPPWTSPVVSKDDFMEYMRRTREVRPASRKPEYVILVYVHMYGCMHVCMCV